MHGICSIVISLNMLMGGQDGVICKLDSNWTVILFNNILVYQNKKATSFGVKQHLSQFYYKNNFVQYKNTVQKCERSPLSYKSNPDWQRLLSQHSLGQCTYTLICFYVVLNIIYSVPVGLHKGKHQWTSITKPKILQCFTRFVKILI